MSGVRRAALATFVVGLGARLAHLLAFTDLPYYRLPFGDSRSFAEEARRILESGPFAGDLPYFQGPLYPLLLAVIQGMGLPLESTYWIQAATGAVTAAVVALLAGHLAGARAALAAGILFALYDAAVFFDVDLLAASPVATLVALGLFLTLTGRMVPAGLALGLAVWGRPNLVLPVVLMVGMIALRPAMATRCPDDSTSRREQRRNGWGALALAAGLVVMLPVVRNLVVSGEPILATGGGVNAYIGNHVGATGTFRIPPRSGLANDLDLERISRQIASTSEGRPLTPGESSTWWLRRALADVGQEPAAALLRTGRKALLFLSAREIPNHLDLDFVRGLSPPLRWMPVRAWLLLPLGMAGLVILIRRGQPLPAAWVLGVAVSVLPFFVTARFRMAAMPMVAVGAGVLIDHLWTEIRPGPGETRPLGERARGLLLPLGVALGTLALALLPLLPPPDHTPAYVNLGALHAELGDPRAAEAAFREALNRTPGDPRARENLAILALGRGDPGAAMAEIEIALRHDPRSSSTWSLRAVALGRLGRWDDAIAAAEHAVELDPGSEGARTNLTTLWRDYLAHCRELLEDAGFAAPATAGERARQAAFLREAGLIRAAEQLLPRSGLPAPPGSP